MSLLGVGSLAGLIVVASLEDAALESVAITLAIITFVVQLIVYVAQAEQARQEGVRSQELHGQLQSNLADLSARAQGTQAAIASINDKVLDRALRDTGLQKLEDLPPGFTRDLAQNVADLLREEPAEEEHERTAQTEFPRKTWDRAEDERVRTMLLTWPDRDEEIEEIREALTDLSEFEAHVLGEFARDELEYRDPDTIFTPAITSPRGSFAQALWDRELIRELGAAYGRPLAALTEKGRRVARVFTAEDDPPAELADLVDKVRGDWERLEHRVGAEDE